MPGTEGATLAAADIHLPLSEAGSPPPPRGEDRRASGSFVSVQSQSQRTDPKAASAIATPKAASAIATPPKQSPAKPQVKSTSPAKAAPKKAAPSGASPQRASGSPPGARGSATASVKPKGKGPGASLAAGRPSPSVRTPRTSGTGSAARRTGTPQKTHPSPAARASPVAPPHIRGAKTPESSKKPAHKPRESITATTASQRAKAVATAASGTPRQTRGSESRTHPSPSAVRRTHSGAGSVRPGVVRARPESPQRSGARSPPRPKSYAAEASLQRLRYPRPSRLELSGGKLDACVGRRGAEVRAMVSTDTTVWCAEADGTVRIRECDGEPFGQVEREAGAPGITVMLFAAGAAGTGRVLIGHEDGTLASFEATTASRGTSDTRPHSSAISVLTAAYDAAGSGGLAVTGGEDGKVTLCDPVTLEQVAGWQAQEGSVSAAASSGLCLFTASRSGQVRRHPLPAGGEADGSLSLPSPVNALALTGRVLWCGGAGLALVDTKSMEKLKQLAPAAGSEICSIVPCGSAVWVCHSDGAMQVWDAQTLELQRQLHNDRSLHTALRVCTVPSDFEVWTGGGGAVQMWRNSEFKMPAWCGELLEKAKADKDKAKAEREAAAAARRGNEEQDMLVRKEKERAGAAHIERENAETLLEATRTALQKKSAEADEERGRRKRLEHEHSDLRKAVLTAHQAVAPPSEHASTYSAQGLRAALAYLVRKAGGTGASDLAESPSPVIPRRVDPESAAIAELRAQVAGLQGELEAKERELKESRANVVLARRARSSSPSPPRAQRGDTDA
eukprot:Hpha_TRINITY_DN13097_c2_g1::TRINITY_DN13097_c2_g1_i1::g.69107::m.69107